MIAAYDGPHLVWSSPMLADAIQARAAEEWRACRQLDGEFGVPLEQFVAHVERVVSERVGDAHDRVHRVLDRLCWRDIHLALGCLLRGERAIRVFLDRFGTYLRHVAHKSAPDSATGDDIEQILRATLFLPRRLDQPGSARLASYQGTGSLAGWLRVIASRLVIDEVRKLKRVEPDDNLDRLACPAGSPLASIESLDAAAKVAPLVRAAIDDLTAEERDLIRRRYRDGRVLREIGAELGKDIATVHRRIATVNAKLWKRIRARAKHDLGLGERDLKSLLGAIAERLRTDDLFVAALAAAGMLDLMTIVC